MFDHEPLPVQLFGRVAGGLSGEEGPDRQAAIVAGGGVGQVLRTGLIPLPTLRVCVQVCPVLRCRRQLFAGLQACLRPDWRAGVRSAAGP